MLAHCMSIIYDDTANNYTVPINTTTVFNEMQVSLHLAYVSKRVRTIFSCEEFMYLLISI